ncbi:hypothetical protein P7H71_01840 [Lactococcus lactis]|jgi:hypothetical protein|uniref:hypothetical protein n=2 Tax=Lactococcus TaxID=1357 RepID=UPI00288D7BC0|nr:hypothetical protein [Lactococcus lactis]MDT2863242.1 hypothetical protein [Lactococcus lactis]MDT2869602.1 hypothetical protein [Lactococcus lactis]MDT2873198.1 hypothetical protein [Lactococcus lactis]MDT2874870.1 hypothetical protein [Lactococcus lactis]MDT2879474.1 hypothetical protein [Lactococcus lactis]
MFKYKVCLNFKKNTGLISQDLKINNKEKSADKQITVEKIMLRNSGISIFFQTKIQLDDFTKIFEMVNRLKNFLIAVTDVSILNCRDDYEEIIYSEDNQGNWVRLVFELSSNIAFIDYQKKLSEDDSKNLVEYMYGFDRLPLSYILLKKSKNISDRRQQFISIMTACEFGVKEFYKETKPDLSIILDNLQSPSIPKLLGSIFYDYFQDDFPKELRKKVQKYVEKRNKLIHTSEDNTPTLFECLDCYSAVLSTLNHLSKFNKSYLYFNLYEEKVLLKPLGNNQAQLVYSDLMNEYITSGQLSISTKVNIENMFDKLKK